jgi:hypothetical protein
MNSAQTFVSEIDFSDLQSVKQQLSSSDAFLDPADDVKLRMPTAQR